MKRLLFVCSRNRRRSPIAETLFFGYEGVEAISAGTSPDAETSVCVELIAWADVVFAMEAVHRKKLNNRFDPLLQSKKIVVLGIRDEYDCMDAELIKILKRKLAPYLPGSSGTSGV